MTTSTPSLTLREIEMTREAVFERAGSARNEREEDRWLGLDAKLADLARAVGGQECTCGHARRSHRYATDLTRCRVCLCTAFTLTTSDTTG